MADRAVHGCEMMLSAPDEPDIQCGENPTVGTNGLYRYCRRHTQMVALAGATTLRWDDTHVVDDPDAPSPIDSDAPASVHGRCTAEEGRAAVARLQRAGAALAGFPWGGSTKETDER